MPARRLPSELVERIWGRRSLPAWIADSGERAMPIGEIWHPDDDPAAALLVKHIFTAERLSIQVHPDDDEARARGLPRGKAEVWHIIDAEPGAVIGLGLKHKISAEALRAAAIDGSIEALIDWRPAKAGDTIYSPGGTIHAIGAGLSLIEVQQNLDLTYRLYDYGRPRELHLDEGVAVADPTPYDFAFTPYDRGAGRQILVEGGAFVLERWTFAGDAEVRAGDETVLLIPIASGGAVDGEPLKAGGVWRIDGSAGVSADGGLDLLAAYPGTNARDGLLVRG
jgi:mannose-6-phosphate isomerase